MALLGGGIRTLDLGACVAGNRIGGGIDGTGDMSAHVYGIGMEQNC